MDQDDPNARVQSELSPSAATAATAATAAPVPAKETPAGAGSEAVEGITMDESGANQGAGVDARRSPFYEWLDNAAIRELVHRSLEISVGERLMLLKGLVPGLVEAMGLAEFDAFLEEVGVKAHRFQEAVDHPGEGRLSRVIPGEELGGPLPAGHDHLPIVRDANHRGAREAERALEGERWARTEHTLRPDNAV